MILALDLGTSTGWAIGHKSAHKPAASGTQSFALRRFDGGGMRYLRFRRWLDEMAIIEVGVKPRVEKVVFEEVRAHKGVDAAHVYGGLMAILMSWCEELTIPCEGIPVGHIKKFATGKGNSPKDKMIESCRALGFSPVDDNEADAIHLFRYSVSHG